MRAIAAPFGPGGYEIAALSAVAREAGCPVHLDGTRFANAVVSSGASPADLSWRAGVDVLCLGATKNGALAAEAVIFFDPERQADRIAQFEYRRKRGGHLLSKGRLLSAQMGAYLKDGLWLDLARRSNAAAAHLAEGLRAAGIAIDGPVDANLIFAHLPLVTHKALQAAGARYYPEPPSQPEDADPLRVRLVTSFSTSTESIDRFLERVAKAGQPR